MECPPELSRKTEKTHEIMNLNDHIFWKVKGTASKVTYKLFMKYCDPVSVDMHDISKEFVSYFKGQYQLAFYKSHLRQFLSAKTHFIGDVALKSSVQLLSACTKMEQMMDELKPYAEQVLFEHLVPMTLVTQKEVTAFNEEPEAFIQ